MNNRPVLVFSLDADGAYFNSQYHADADNANRLIEHNEILISEIVECSVKHSFSTTVIMNGSSRQSHRIDHYNSEGKIEPGSSQRKTGSCFSALRTIAAEVQKRIRAKGPEWSNYECAVNTYLLPDTYNSKAHGHSFQCAEALTELDLTQPECKWDASKFTLLYPQTHKLAQEYPTAAEIIFYFFDNKKSILSGLKEMYVQHPDFLPKRLKLRLRQYDGTAIKMYDQIRGSGDVDQNYEKNVMFMGSHLDLDHPSLLQSSFDAQAFAQLRKQQQAAIAPQNVSVVEERQLQHRSSFSPLLWQAAKPQLPATAAPPPSPVVTAS